MRLVVKLAVATYQMAFGQVGGIECATIVWFPPTSNTFTIQLRNHVFVECVTLGWESVAIELHSPVSSTGWEFVAIKLHSPVSSATRQWHPVRCSGVGGNIVQTQSICQQEHPPRPWGVRGGIQWTKAFYFTYEKELKLTCLAKKGYEFNDTKMKFLYAQCILQVGMCN